ncbi:MAG: tRNA pseudouridine(55) synthase TruB [Candidatus Gracilibacteria bacterium]|nr:tRNA pseudouridine(55) synthase TruB [Candidatus Gracilibacteria bacterium]
MNKFYLIDKPLDVTSFDVIRILRKKLNTSKMGHTGTLDPLATGGLLVAVGNYTKLIPYFEKDTKEYVFTVNLDGVSPSFDLGTQVEFISSEAQKIAKESITNEKIEKLLNLNFTGKISQIPPKYSALKMGGKKALDKIRSGEEFEMKAREVTIKDIELLDFSYPSATIRAVVSAGTYIRSIAYDLGDMLGTGGYVTKLRRTKIGSLDISFGQNLDEFDATKSFDIKELFKKKSFITLPNDVLQKINNGLIVEQKFDLEIGVDLFVYDGENITNIVEYDGEKLFAKRKI